MPRLNAKAMAEMLNKPAYDQARILHEQKYPKKQPQVFMTPFYSPALSAIRGYYRAGSSAEALKNSLADITQIGHQAKREHNLRVLARFKDSEQHKRPLALQVNEQASVTIDTVEIRLSADLRAKEAEKPRVLFYNCRGVVMDPGIAQKTLEIGYWILQENDTDIPPRAMEFVDLHAGKVYHLVKPNPSTIRLVRKNIKIIEALWPTV